MRIEEIPGGFTMIAGGNQSRASGKWSHVVGMERTKVCFYRFQIEFGSGDMSFLNGRN